MNFYVAHLAVTVPQYSLSVLNKTKQNEMKQTKQTLRYMWPFCDPEMYFDLAEALWWHICYHDKVLRKKWENIFLDEI